MVGNHLRATAHSGPFVIVDSSNHVSKQLPFSPSCVIVILTLQLPAQEFNTSD